MRPAAAPRVFTGEKPKEPDRKYLWKSSRVSIHRGVRIVNRNEAQANAAPDFLSSSTVVVPHGAATAL